jgi:hypothetical protein
LHRKQDSFRGTRVLVGGGNWLYVTPGIGVLAGKGINVQAEIKVPLYRSLSNKQLALLASASATAQTIVVTRSGSRAVRPAPAENFTGGVRVEMLFEALDPSHASGGSVSFEPGARTA